MNTRKCVVTQNSPSKWTVEFHITKHPGLNPCDESYQSRLREVSRQEAFEAIERWLVHGN
jgi:hypothetical protein